MWRKLACTLAGSVLIGAIGLPIWVLAQELQTEQKRRAAEFVRLYERLEQAQEAEEKLAIGERLLALEGALKDWPLPHAREGVKGVLWLVLGSAYANRTSGDRSENLEKAIAAYRAAQTVFTREFIPREWAFTEHSIGIAFLNRIR